MRKIKLLGYLVILLSGFMFLQCTSDEPIYVAGEDGIDGVDGVDGVDGSAAACIACHSNANREPIHDSYMLSAHAEGGAVGYAGSRAGCAQCHSNEGYLDFLDTGVEAEENFSNPTPVSCTTCHSNHSTFDFENDGPDYALRATEPFTLFIDDVTVIDFEGTSNSCIGCHQPRNSYDIPGPTGDYTISSKRFGPHHGPHSTMIEGIMGANLAGSTEYPTAGSAAHRSGASCVSCHMGESTDINEGLHSWNPLSTCTTTCHGGGESIPSVVSGFAADLQILKDLLLAQNLINDSGYVLGNDGLEIANDGSNAIVVPAHVAQAIWNYKTLVEDGTNGLHNPNYAKALLANSIEALQQD